MDWNWKEFGSAVVFGMVAVYVFNTFKDLLTDIRNSLRSIEGRLERDDD